MKKIVVVVLCFFATKFDSPLKKYNANIKITEYFSAEQYTESDKLLNFDGTEDDKTIREFAAEVKAAFFMS